MNPILKRLQDAIYNQLDPLVAASTEKLPSFPTKLSSQSFQQQFMDEYQTLTCKNTQATYIENTQLICVHLLDKIQTHRSQIATMELPGQKKNKLVTHYSLLENTLIECIEFILDLIPHHSNHLQKIPAIYREQLHQQLEIFIQKNKNSTLLSIVVSAFHQKYHDNETLNYIDYQYWKKLIQKLEQIHENPNQVTETDTMYLLIRFNFNHEGFHEYLMQYFEAQNGIIESDRHHDPLEKWTQILKKILLLQEQQGMALNPGIPRCKKTILQCIRYEIKFNNQLFQNKKSIATIDKPENEAPILFNLSVSQLGILFRAMVKTDMIDTKVNVTNLTEKISCIARTAYKEDLSPNKLSQAYYAYKPAAIEIVKTRLLNLVRWLQNCRPTDCLKAVFLEQFIDMVTVLP